MLDKVKELGLEKFAGDESLADTFVESFKSELMEKLAAKDQHQSGPDALKEFINGFSGNIGKGLGGLAVTTGVSALASLGSSMKNGFTHTRFLQALEKAIASNPLLEANKAKAVKYGETLFKFAPEVSTDPNLLSSVLANAIHGEGIDPQTIKSLTDLEGRLKENRGFTPKAYV